MTLLEAVCCSVDDCVRAQDAGVDRIELCIGIELGGLTPSAGLLKTAKASVDVPILAMIRPRAGWFRYSESEIATMREDLAALRAAGADGFVMGALDEHDRVCKTANAQLIEAAGGLPATFHRAFDSTPDALESLDALIELGFARVMTSGHEVAALEGAPMLRQLRERADGRIVVVAAGRVRPKNVREIIEATGCVEVHVGPFIATEEPGYESFRAVRLDDEEVREIKLALND
jgi:copper homeostasis protein